MRSQFKKGDKVKVRKGLGAIIYTVDCINGFVANLTYVTAGNQTVNGGTVDTSILIKVK